VEKIHASVTNKYPVLCERTGLRPGRSETIAALRERNPAMIGIPKVRRVAVPSPPASPTSRQTPMKMLWIASTAARALNRDLVSTPAPEDALQARDITLP